MTVPSNGTVPRIFVSHNHQDNAYCREFVTALRQEIGSNEAVWYDEHNLGWGKLRREIERELAQRQHFIAIFSPTAVDSEWVNDEIDAAIELRRRGIMQTLQFVIALPCEMPLLLSNYKRVVAPDGQPYPAPEAARRALAVIRPAAVAPSATPPPVQQALQRPILPPVLPIAADHFPQRLASLGFEGKTALVDGKTIEYLVPPLCAVPAGPFLMGSDPQRDAEAAREAWAKARELPHHSVTLAAYRIARYPVTVAEYACFVRAWQREPSDWQSQLGTLDHPVVNVTWYDATAYAKWLSERTGQLWHLPTEAEWEKAARGTDGRLYPWGDQFDAARGNTSESGIKTTTPVGSYPSGASPYGTLDMAGNVWEWTSTLYKPYPYNEAGERESVDSIGNRVLRGGSWDNNAGYARAACRLDFPPAYFYVGYGFRLVLRTTLVSV